MKTKLIGLIKILFWKLLYRRRLIVSGIPRNDLNSKIKLYKTGKMVMGKNCNISANSYLAAIDGGTIVLGDSVFFNRNAIVASRNSIRIGNNCAFGPNVVIYDHDHCFSNDGIESGYKLKTVTIGDNCWIGAGCIILRGATIGEGCVIGAGTVITGEIPAHSKVLAKSSRELEITSI